MSWWADCTVGVVYFGRETERHALATRFVPLVRNRARIRRLWWRGRGPEIRIKQSPSTTQWDQLSSQQNDRVPCFAPQQSQPLPQNRFSSPFYRSQTPSQQHLFRLQSWGIKYNINPNAKLSKFFQEQNMHVTVCLSPFVVGIPIHRNIIIIIMHFMMIWNEDNCSKEPLNIFLLVKPCTSVYQKGRGDSRKP